jgi:spore germination cell wall hydrolase CwlJ-like protein
MSTILDDAEAVALCQWREARSEGEIGMRAVGHVIVNRAASWYHQMRYPVHFAVYAKNQFTSMSCPSDPQYRRFPAEVDPQWQFCQQIAPEILADADPDPTNGALYYANLEIITPGCWFEIEVVLKPQIHPLLIVIRNHHFYA